MMANRKEAFGIWLSDLLVGLALITFDRQVTGLSLDSRDVMAGDLFFAVSGANSHGLNFAVDAFNKGAIAIVYDPLDTVGFCDKSIASEVLIEIPQLSEKMGAIAARFYGKPSSKYCVIGVTGTNGKTSCVQFLQQCLPYSSSIGTLGWGTGKSLAVTKNTTPDAVELQRILAQLQGWGVRHVAMEVSSHGLQQKRVAGVSFDGVMITNITRDHLDYHGCMDNYVAAKLALLTVPEVRFAVVNFSGNFLEQILATIPENVRIWGVSFDGKKRGGVNVLDISAVTCYEGGLCFDVEYQSDRQGVTVPLYGEVNVENVAMVMAALLALGYSLREA
ncbi:MAG: UDP-N-acetylmuramoyl-L-alanyl-D-glutamate--2,6-diaminopimelate ligase, partial [Methylococcales bacterium]|nr:UDP-N-acetylmuramoyl-L-alanyl-D-glutamate--2,6-diaminopimelate ligase [Methylococcales bacterium]